MQYWDILLSEWREEGNDGFTIPYIIGSQNYLPDTHDEQDIEELIVDIIENSTDEIYMKYCMNTGEIIFGIRDETKINIPGRFPDFKGKPQNILFQTTYVYDLGDNVETIISSLTERYQRYINFEQYSKNDREWGDYSANEKTFIKKCFTE